MPLIAFKRLDFKSLSVQKSRLANSSIQTRFVNRQISTLNSPIRLMMYQRRELGFNSKLNQKPIVLSAIEPLPIMQSPEITMKSDPIEERMLKLGPKPFRKITVADVIRPGRKPSLATCLQTCRITADELRVRLSRRVYEISNLPIEIRENLITREIVEIYKETFVILCEYTDKVEKLRLEPIKPTIVQKIWSKFSDNKVGVEELAPKEQDLENIQYGGECTDPALLYHLKPLTFEFIQILKNIVKRHQPVPSLIDY